MGISTLGTASGARTARSGRARWRLRAHPVGRADSLLRNGHLLTASSLLTSAFGAGYWMIVTRWYSPASVGRGYSSVSVMMFLAGLGQLNLANTLIRFVPSAGPRTRRLIARVYLVAVAVSLTLGTGFVLAVPLLAPQLGSLRAPIPAVGFVAATGAYAVFVIQDGALTGLRRADWVIGENAAFATVKVGFLVVFAQAGLGSGILLSWYAALGVSIGITSVFLFARAIPAHVASPAPSNADISPPTLRYLATDLTGSLCWLAATTLPPVLVMRVLGAAQSAYFSLCWVIAYALYLLSSNMGSSLIVETVNDVARTAAHARRVLRHTAVLISGCVLAVVAFAPRLLALFGPGYAANGSGLLRLLALSAVPNLVVATAVAVSRSRRRLAVAVGALATVCATALGLTVLLLPRMGIAGAGVGWLTGQCIAATVLLARPSWWLGARGSSSARAPLRLGEIRRAVHSRIADLAAWPADRLAAMRTLRLHTSRGTAARVALAACRARRSHSDLLVARAVDLRRAAVKVPRTEQARMLLARQTEVLDKLWTDTSLGGWRLLLPEILVRGDSTPDSSVAEHWLPGVTGSHLLRKHPLKAASLAETAVEAIAPLHRSARTERIGPAHLKRWLDPPLAVLAHSLVEPDADPVALDCLRRRLYARLEGRSLRVGWVHRDFHPGNVLFRADGRDVGGIVDWGGAIPDGPTAVDAVMFGLATAHETSGRPIGELVAAAMTATVPEDGLLLLAWLWHVTDNLEKSQRYRANSRWIAENVQSVLTTLKAVHT